MRKLAAIATGGIGLILCFAGCGDQRKGDQLLIGAVSVNASDPFWQAVECGAKAAADELGVNLVWRATNNIDVRAMLANLRAVETEDPDGLILAPASEVTFTAPVAELMKDGVPVSLVSAELAEPVAYQQVGSQVTDRNFEELASMIAASVGEEGRVAVLAGIPNTAMAEPRFDPIIDALAEFAPSVEVLPAQYARADRATAVRVAAALLARGDIDAIYATNGPEGAGAAAAVREASSDVPVFAFDATPEEVAALRAGEIDALLAQSPIQMGREAVRSVVERLQPRDVADRDEPITTGNPYAVETDSMILTRDNVDSPTGRAFHYSSDC